jgi:hypothetical protein
MPEKHGRMVNRRLDPVLVGERKNFAGHLGQPA